jgi:hypothetical protein
VILGINECSTGSAAGVVLPPSYQEAADRLSDGRHANGQTNLSDDARPVSCSSAVDRVELRERAPNMTHYRPVSRSQANSRMAARS